MYYSVLLTTIITFALQLNLVGNSFAETLLFEDGVLGATGITGDQVQHQDVFGINVFDRAFQGSRFQVDEQVRVTNVGGHFVATPGVGGTFFGAIVRLTDADDVPDSGDLSTPDVVGSAVLTFPEPSADVYGGVDLLLDPGWYVLVFGSGLFEASGSGAAVTNGPPITSPIHLFWQPGSGWSRYFSLVEGTHFVVRGEVIPEPITPILLALGILLPLVHRNRRECRSTQNGENRLRRCQEKARVLRCGKTTSEQLSARATPHMLTVKHLD